MKYLLVPEIIFSSLTKIAAAVDGLNAAINHRIETTGAQYRAFGIFGICNYPIYYFIWKYASHQSYENLPMRLIATFLCIGLVFERKWPKNLKPFLPIYWYVTLLYCLPFFFTFMLIKNEGSLMWVTNTITVILFVLLLVDWISSLILLTLGFLLGIIAAYSSDDFHFIISFDYIGFSITCAVSILIGVIFAHNNEKVKNEKLRTIKVIGENIAHELRTPLRTILSGANGLKQYLPKLIETYLLAKNAKLNIPEIEDFHYSALKNALDNISSEVHSAFTFIKILLVNTNEKINKNDYESHTISTCIQTALERYPFDLGEQQIVEWKNENDFFFKGKQELMVHVIFNLLKNALYYIKAANKGKIYIWTETKGPFNKLYFKDTGAGIPKKILPEIFDRFFSKTYHGTGVGLAFCKLVMKSFGGDIICRSVEGEYTEFVMIYPAILS